MTPHLDRPWVGITVVLWAIGAVLFVILNNAFGGPTIGFSHSYQVSATIGDAQGLLTKSVVMTRGVPIGSVSSRALVGDRVRFTLSLDSSVTPLYRDALLSIRKRTLFGEPYVDLDRGHPAAGALASGATLPASQVQPSIQLDQALAALDAPTRRHLASLGATGAAVDRDPNTAQAFSATVDGFGRVLTQLHAVGAALDDERPALSRFVSAGRAVLTELGGREQELRALIGQGRITAETFAAQTPALEAALAAIPRFERAARLTLHDARPVLEAATPVVLTLAAASASLATAFRDLPATARSAREVVLGLPGLRAAAVPVLHGLGPVIAALLPAATRLDPFLRDLVPVTQYAAPFTPDLVGLIGGAGAGVHRLLPNGYATTLDPAYVRTLKPRVGWGPGSVLWGRFLVDGDRAYTTDVPDANTKQNPYPRPHDPFSSYVPASYPHLMPYPAFR
jgi:phospholipid/cholesterol/gamma-HCH transport system substrate-binding protein